MKARDLIPGWPRGRTTIAAHPEGYDCFSWLFKSEEARVYARANDAYHLAQQEMVDCYLEQWRIGLACRRDEMQEFFAAMIGLHVARCMGVGTHPTGAATEPRTPDPKTCIGSFPLPEREGP